ncbi:MAG: hypothetical protein Q8L99_14585, partial [Polycyclovorans sp.]|nr:hypothetical protein [Polycyclovorans sp.]
MQARVLLGRAQAQAQAQAQVLEQVRRRQVPQLPLLSPLLWWYWVGWASLLQQRAGAEVGDLPRQQRRRALGQEGQREGGPH